MRRVTTHQNIRLIERDQRSMGLIRASHWTSNCVYLNKKSAIPPSFVLLSTFGAFWFCSMRRGKNDINNEKKSVSLSPALVEWSQEKQIQSKQDDLSWSTTSLKIDWFPNHQWKSDHRLRRLLTIKHISIKRKFKLWQSSSSSTRSESQDTASFSIYFDYWQRLQVEVEFHVSLD